MRNWNGIHHVPIGKDRKEFIAYLWGIETELIYANDKKNSKFIAYLWGIETVHFFENFFEKTEFIAYLWGIETEAIKKRSKKRGNSLSRTYEELKHPNNGLIYCRFFEFIAYLWGIETKCVALYQFEFFLVYRVPMRNWNQDFLTNNNLLIPVYRVPMRNWNTNGKKIITLHYQSLSRTYEELKRSMKYKEFIQILGLSRTYEELKLGVGFINIC